MNPEGYKKKTKNPVVVYNEKAFPSTPRRIVNYGIMSVIRTKKTGGLSHLKQFKRKNK